MWFDEFNGRQSMSTLEASGARPGKDSRVTLKAGQVVGGGRRRRWLAWGYSAVGLFSLVWFLVRVIPKPSRAAYPCQRAAFPLASSFVVWVTAVLGSAFAWRKFRRWEARFWHACLWGAAALALGALVVASLPTARVWAGNPPHGVLGVAKGIFPGRVAWVHAPEATSWAGYSSAEHWYETNHTDLAVVERMMSRAVQAVGGGDSDAAAWDAIFRYFNVNHGRGDRGYQAGEKIAIKINLAACWSGRWPTNYVDIYGTYEKQNNVAGDTHWRNTIDNSPQMLLSLLRQLVYVAGVSPTNVYLGDPTGNFPKYMWDKLHPEFAGVHYFDNYGGQGRMRTELSSVPFNWSTNASWSTNGAGKLQDYVPVPFAEAAYVIDFAVLKGHSTGITACGKNWYGALLRLPNGWYRDAKGKDQADYLDYVNMHYSTPRPKVGGYAGMGHYRGIVDLMGHPALGGKTLLYLVDGLFAGYYSESRPVKWTTAPFNNNWPSTLFASQDPVAIDSVCYDFLLNEWPNIVNYGYIDPTSTSADDLQGGAEDYLHEAALADNPPSGTFYDPGRTGARLASLGAHEHWNNATNKQYSRNLGTGQGIELVALTAGPLCTPAVLLNGDFEGATNALGVGTNWIAYQRGPTPPTTVWSVQTNLALPGGGLHYQQILSTSSTGGAGVRQDVAGCTIGAVYQVAGWMRGTSGAYATCTVKVSPTASTDWSTAIDLDPPQTFTGNYWTNFSGTVVATGTSLTIWLDGQTTGTGQTKAELFDGVTVTCVGRMVPPVLAARQDGASLIFGWPTNYGRYSLIAATNLGTGATWSAVLPLPAESGGTNVVTNGMTGERRFYRLRQP